MAKGFEGEAWPKAVCGQVIYGQRGEKKPRAGHVNPAFQPHNRFWPLTSGPEWGSSSGSGSGNGFKFFSLSRQTGTGCGF